MGWFSQVTDFLSSPGFRIGAGVAGLASGAGAFSGMGDWGTALQGLSGAANLAAGGASTFGPNRSALDRATGALQLGLGGYNVGQAFGQVGSFGDVWNQISGDGGGGTTREGGMIPFSGTENTPTGTSFTPPAAPDAFQAPDTLRTGYRGPLSDATGLPPDPRAQLTPADIPGAWTPPPAAAPAAGDAGPAPTAPPPALDFGSATSPPAPAPTPAALPPIVPTAPAAPAVPPLVAPIAAPPTVPSDPNVARSWLGRTWDNLATQAEKSPIAAGMAAMQVGSMLIGLFQQSSSDIARDAMSQMDPNSPNGAEFRRLFEERGRREIDEQAETARSSLQAKFASRGMLNSTVYTNALQSLETARGKLIVDLPYNSLKAWNETAVGSGNAMRGAAALTTATRSNMDFSNMTRVLGQSPFAQQVAAGSRTPANTQITTPPSTPLDELYR